MPLFNYVAKTQSGNDQTGKLQASNKHELASLLRTQGLVLISAKPLETAQQLYEQTDRELNGSNLFVKYLKIIWEKLAGSISTVSLAEKMVFSRHLAVMIEAGLSLNQSLGTLSKQAGNLKFKKIIIDIESNIRQGKPFSEALSKYPKVFSNLYVNMVKVGETSGNLSNILKILADQMKKDHDLISRVRGAMMYPAVILIALVGIGILMMILVVPKITAVFDEMEMELPFTTRLIIGTSKILSEHYLLGLIILIAVIVTFRLLMKIYQVKRVVHKVYLHLPIFSGLSQKINSARFARTLSSLSESGVAIVKSLEIVSDILGNVHFKNSLKEAAEQVQKGTKLSTALSKYDDLYMPMVIQMIGVGEETGKLSEILKDLAEFYQEGVDNTTKNLSTIIEPIIMIIIGAIVGLFAISMVQPMYSMMSGI